MKDAADFRSGIPSVCVVVPIYKNVLTGTERVALERCISVLGRYDVVVVKPASLDIRWLDSIFPGLGFESFDDDFFRGVDGYNRLMLSDLFYARFDDFEYILIYQLDAFVFSDRLHFWCGQGYDYLGAPWMMGKTAVPPSLRFRIKRRIYQLLDVRNGHGGGMHRAQYGYVAGNGGFSLRRVSAMRNALVQRGEAVSKYLERGHHTHNEDIFYCVEVNRWCSLLKLAPFDVALQFSWESNPAESMSSMGGRLPFGCHGWDRLYREEWRSIFTAAGLDMKGVLDEHPNGQLRICQ